LRVGEFISRTSLEKQHYKNHNLRHAILLPAAIPASLIFSQVNQILSHFTPNIQPLHKTSVTQRC